MRSRGRAGCGSDTGAMSSNWVSVKVSAEAELLVPDNASFFLFSARFVLLFLPLSPALATHVPADREDRRFASSPRCSFQIFVHTIDCCVFMERSCKKKKYGARTKCMGAGLRGWNACLWKVEGQTLCNCMNNFVKQVNRYNFCEFLRTGLSDLHEFAARARP